MAAAALFSTASSLFSGSKLASAYTIAGSGAGLASSSSSGTGHTAGYTTQIAMWTIQKAVHKSNGKAVSIWTFDKGNMSGKGKAKLDACIEVLKKEVSMLSRLRHPCVLEVVEPLEETRTSMTFATEPISGSLRVAMHASEPTSASRHRKPSTQEATQMGELDEIEIQKGLLQIGKALQFLHESAKLVHSNLTPDAIVINAKGDWKLSGFGLSTYLASPTGESPKWDFPSYERGLPQAVQKDFDYMAPEFALDETLAPSNDMYALGCIINAIHTKSGPPFTNRHNLQTLRDNVENLGSLRAGWHRLPDEVQDVLSQLLTRYPSTRLTAVAFQSSRYFSSILVSTLRFLDRDNFSATPREGQVSFLKGLLKVLPQFSDKVTKRKILPSLVEETRKNMLVPFLLPCIMYIGEKMDKDEFKETILPSIKPLFAVKDPPQTMLSLLDSLKMLHDKCNAVTFREEVLPLVYNALDSEVPQVLEKALKVIVQMAEGLDYTTVKQSLLPKITNVFSKTTSLSVKVATLVCFKSMVPVLDKFTLTEKLVPLLSRIKTKEPSVMLATLAVHEQIGAKCDIQAIATLVLPQLWAMSVTPLLDVGQFGRFMSAIRQLGARVEEEHTRHLAEIKRLEETSGAGSSRGGARSQRNGDSAGMLGSNGAEVDFESLVRGNSAQGSRRAVTPDPFGPSDDFAKFDGLSVSSSQPSSAMTASLSLSPQSSASRFGATSSSKASSMLGARPISSATYLARAGGITPDISAPNTPPAVTPSTSYQQTSVSALPPPMSLSSSRGQSFGSNNASTYSSPPATLSSPNYNVPMAGQQPTMSLASNTGFMQPLQPTTSSLYPQASNAGPSYMSPMQAQPASSASTPVMAPSTIRWDSTPALQPSTMMQPQQLQPSPVHWGSGAILQPTKKETSYDWSDLDPMR